MLNEPGTLVTPAYYNCALNNEDTCSTNFSRSGRASHCAWVTTLDRFRSCSKMVVYSRAKVASRMFSVASSLSRNERSRRATMQIGPQECHNGVDRPTIDSLGGHAR